MSATTEEPGLEIQILADIRDSEKKAEQILAKAREEKEAITHDAVVAASANFSQKSDEIRKIQEKKVSDFREKIKLLKEEKLLEGKSEAKQLLTKSGKNKGKAVDYIINKFEEMINA